MPSWRRPKGLVTRFIPDWSSSALGFGSLFAGGAGISTQRLGLVNNDSQGNYYAVWDCTISIGVFAAASVPLGNAVWQVAKAPVTGFTEPVGALNPNTPLGMPTGQIASGFNVTGVDPNAATYQVLAGPGTWVWPHDWPMCYIPAGQNLIATFGLNNAQCSLSVIYEVTKYL